MQMAEDAWRSAIEPLLASAAEMNGARCATVWRYRDDQPDADLWICAEPELADGGKRHTRPRICLAPLPNRAMLLPVWGVTGVDCTPQIWKVSDETPTARRRTIIQSWQAAHGFTASVLIPLCRAEDDALLGLVGLHFRRVMRLRDKHVRALQSAAAVVLQALEADALRAGSSAQQIREAAQQEERSRIARELHDTVVQDVTSALLHVNLAAATYGVQDVRPALAAARQSAATALAELRECLSRLKSCGEGPTHLSSAVSSCAAQVIGDSGPLTLRIDVDGLERPVPGEKGWHLLRIVREALTNVLKHAVGATAVVVRLRFDADSVELAVTDNGCGFAPEVLRNAPEMGRFGLRGIQERAELLNALLSVQSGPGEGTTVSVRVPTSVPTA